MPPWSDSTGSAFENLYVLPASSASRRATAATSLADFCCSCSRSALVKVGSSVASTWPFFTTSPAFTLICRTMPVSKGVTYIAPAVVTMRPALVTTRSSLTTADSAIEITMMATSV